MSSSIGSLGLGGLISGMNTDDIINKITAIASQQIKDVQRQKTDLQAKQAAWGQVRGSLNTLRTALDGIRLSSDFRFRQAALSDSTVATVTAGAGAALTTHTLSVTQLAQVEVAGSATGAPVVTDATATLDTDFAGFTTGTLTVNTKAIAVDKSDNLYSLRDKINAAGAGVTAQVIKVVDGTTTKYNLTLTASAASATQMTITDDGTSGIAQMLGLTDGTGAVSDMVQGRLASFKLDGVQYNTNSNTISDAVPGLNITLLKAAPDPNPATTQISISQNTDQTATNVQAWVDALNAAISQLSDLTKYDSTTGEKGVLNGDSLARDLRTQLKDFMGTQVFGNGKYTDLSTIGITSGAYGSADYGKILLDKTKLTAALADSPDGVARLFGALRQNVAVAGAAGTVTDAGQTYDASVFNFTSSSTIDEIQFSNPDGAATNPTAGLKDFDVSYQDANGNWKLIRSYTNFVGTQATIDFDPVLAQAIKIQPKAMYGTSTPNITGLTPYESNKGVAVQMYRFVNSTLAFSTGVLDTRDSTYNTQIKGLDTKIADMNTKLANQQDQLRLQFQQMEQSLQQLQAQGSQLSSMLGGMTK